MEQLELSNYLSESVKWYNRFYLKASLTLNMCHSYDPAILPVPKRCENRIISNSSKFFLSEEFVFGCVMRWGLGRPLGWGDIEQSPGDTEEQDVRIVRSPFEGLK